MTDQADVELVLAVPPRRSLTNQPPESVAAAVIDFLTAVLMVQAHRVVGPLRGQLEGIWSAPRGTYRILYRVHEDVREVVVLRIEHRRIVYRPQ